MKIVVACDSFKGSMTSKEVGEACASGFRGGAGRNSVDVEVVCVGDGGEGTSEALRDAMGGRDESCIVCGPAGEKVKARYMISADGRTAVMEMAEASGLTLVAEEKRNPMLTSTYGTGEMILDALKKGCRGIIIGIGGSATVDGGTGMLSALGARFSDVDGNELLACGGNLDRIAKMDLSGLRNELRDADIRVICDVDNPLYGERGAARVFGPQKGADPEMVERLEAGMINYARVMGNALGKDISGIAGAGAAGGMGAALSGVLGAQLENGIDVVLDLIDFDNRIDGASLIITGEGRMDSQTLHGKTPAGILKRGKARGIPVVAITGAVEDSEILEKSGFRAIFPVEEGPCGLAEAMEKETALNNVERTSRQIARLTIEKIF